jgi:hypothetical protein
VTRREWNVTHEFEFATKGTPAAALQRLVQFIENQNGRVANLDTNGVTGFFGSNLVLRLIGVAFQAGRQRLPIILQAKVGSIDERAVVNVTLTSNEGWFAWRMSALDKAIQDRFKQLEISLRDTFPGS